MLKRTYGLVFGSIVALGLGACGDDADGDSSTSDTDPSTSSTSGTDTNATPGTTTMEASSSTTADTEGDTEGDTDPTTTGDGGVAQIRVIHGAPGAPAVDVYVAGTSDAAVSNLPYGDASPYLEVPAGDYAFDIRAAGADPSEDPAFTTDTLTLEDGAVVSALAAGLLGSESADDQFRVIPLVEGFEDPGAGQAAVRVVHAGSDAPTVDIDVGNDGTAELEGVDRFAESGAAGVALPADTELQIGIAVGGETVTAFTTPALPEGGELFVIATGLLGDLPRADSGFSLLAVAPDGAIGLVRQNPRVYAYHASPDAPNVDICAGEAALLADVPYGAMAPIQVPPGEYTLDIYAAGSDCMGEPAASPMTPALAAGEQYLAVATGELAPEAGDPSFQLSAFAEAFPLDSSEDDAVFRIIHSASAPTVAVGLVDEGGEMQGADLLTTSLSWPDINTRDLVVPGGDYAVGVAAAGPMPPLTPLAVFDVPAAAGFRGFVMATGALAPENDESPFELIAIVTGPGPWVALPIPVQR